MEDVETLEIREDSALTAFRTVEEILSTIITGPAVRRDLRKMDIKVPETPEQDYAALLDKLVMFQNQLGDVISTLSKGDEIPVSNNPNYKVFDLNKKQYEEGVS